MINVSVPYSGTVVHHHVNSLLLGALSALRICVGAHSWYWAWYTYVTNRVIHVVVIIPCHLPVFGSSFYCEPVKLPMYPGS